jgi:hypothetical protein
MTGIQQTENKLAKQQDSMKKLSESALSSQPQKHLSKQIKQFL